MRTLLSPVRPPADRADPVTPRLLAPTPELTLAQQLAQISQPAPQGPPSLLSVSCCTVTLTFAIAQTLTRRTPTRLTPTDAPPRRATTTTARLLREAPTQLRLPVQTMSKSGALPSLSLGGSQEASADSLERRSASKLRKRGEAVLDAKYDGKKGSRAALYGDGEDDDEEEESPAEEDDELDGLGGEEDDEGEDDDDEMGDFEDLEGASEGASEEEAASGEDEDEEEEDEEDDDAPMPPPSSTSRPSQPRSERAMVSQLQRAASADVEKGRDVKKQLAFCDSLLEARIKLQKAVGAVNSLPPPPSAESYFAEARSEVDEARREIEGLGEELFALREVRPLGLVPSSLARVSRRLTPPVHAPHSRAEPPRDQREDRAPRRLWRVAQAQADVLGCGGLGGVPRRDALGPCRPRGCVRPSPPPNPLSLPATKLMAPLHTRPRRLAQVRPLPAHDRLQVVRQGPRRVGTGPL